MPKTVEEFVAEREKTGNVVDRERATLELSRGTKQSRMFAIKKPVKAIWSIKAYYESRSQNTSKFGVTFSIEDVPDSAIISSNYQFTLNMTFKDKTSVSRNYSGALATSQEKFEVDDTCKYTTNTGDKIMIVCDFVIKYVGPPRMRNKLYEPIGYSTALVFKDMLKNPILSDFKFIVKGKEFKVHKSVLAAASPMLLKMFTVDMAENKEGISRIDHIEPEIFEAMLKFVYGGEVLEHSDSKQLYAAAHYFDIKSLKKICEQKVHTSLNVENAVDIFLWAFPFEELEALKFDAWDVIKSKALNNLRLEEFETVDFEVIKEVLEKVKSLQLTLDLNF